MQLSLRIDGIPEITQPSPILLSTFDAEIHKESTNGNLPTSVFSREDGAKTFVESLIRSCIRTHGPDSKATAWVNVEKRLSAYQLKHTAWVFVDPLRVLIRIY